MVVNKSLLNKKIKNFSCLPAERDNQPALRAYSQLGHELQTSDVFGVIDAVMILKRTFVLPPTNSLIKKTLTCI